MVRTCSPRTLWSRLMVAIGAALATILGVAALSVPAGAVEGAASTATTVTMSSTSLSLGDTVTLSADVTSDGAPVPHGQVIFDAAPSEATLWGADSYVDPYPDASDVSWGPISLSAGGTASVEIAVDADTLPFLAAGTDLFVAAEYQPYDGLGIYDAEFSTSDSEPLAVPVAAPAPAPTATTTTVTGPSAATAGVPTSLTAIVAPADVVGTVRFSVDGSPVGAAVPVVSGSASASYTFSAGSRTVTAAFTPADPAAYAPSADTAGRAVTILDPPTPTPAPAPAPEPATTTAKVTAEPTTRGATQVVRLKVEVTSSDHTTPQGYVRFLGTKDEFVGTAVLVEGAGTTTVDLDQLSSPVDQPRVQHGVAAVFVPADAGRYRSSLQRVGLDDLKWSTPGSTAAGAPVATRTVVLAGSTGQPGCGAASRRKSVADSPFITGLVMLTPAWTPTRPLALDLALDIAVTVRQGYLPPSPFCQAQRGRPAAARATTTTEVTCALTAAGYQCPLGTVPPGTSFTASITYPLPAVAAGRKIGVTSAAVATDPVTGVTTTLVTKHTTVRVPRRTVLSATIAPVKKGGTVRRGAKVGYRVVVHNAGVIAAHHVTACFSPGKGARVRSAKGARVTSRMACWRLPTLGGGKTVRRSLTFVPRRKAALRPSLVVVPKKSEAGRVKLRTVLPVR